VDQQANRRDQSDPGTTLNSGRLIGSPGVTPFLKVTDLDRVDGEVSGDLLDRLAATDRLHGDTGLELKAVGSALAHWWEPRSGAVPRLRG